MLALQVLIGELLAVDGFATRALSPTSASASPGTAIVSYVAAGEVTALKHELRDDAVELGALVAEAVFAGAQLVEVSGRLGHLVVVELEAHVALLR